MLLSLLLYSFRPYKLAQQALGDCIMATADYLRVRASFYEKEVDYEKTYQRMLEQQIAVHEKQNLVRELFYKSRHIIKDSTTTGRTLVMIFTDIVDLFERTMTSYHDYKALHEAFDEDDILQQYRQLILELSNELDEIGIAVKSGEASEETGLLATHINNTKTSLKHSGIINALQKMWMTLSACGIFLTASRILPTAYIRCICTPRMIKRLQKKEQFLSDYDQFVTHEAI